MNPKLVASAALLLGSLLWGALIPMIWALTRVYDSVSLAVLRYLIAMPVLAIITWLWGRAGLRRPLPWRKILLLGLPMAFFAIVFNIGIANSHPVTSAIILMCGPLIYTVIGRRMAHAPIPPGFGVALALSVIGGIVVVLGGPGRTADSSIGLQGGEPLLLLAQLTWAWYSVRAQEWLADRGQFALSFLTSAACTLLLFVAYGPLLALGAATVPTHAPTTLEVVFLLWAGAGGVALAVVLWNFGVSRLALPVASLHNNTIPIFAALASISIGIWPTWQQLVGGAIVLAGVAFLQLRQVIGGLRRDR
jgi:drug/metabolite transporter (DMT)-like permease